MIVDVLYSGSRGNCTLIRDGVTEILIDCGKSARAVCSALREAGTDIENISAIFVTHEHSDHISALDNICSSREIPVHITKPSADAAGKKLGFVKNLVIHPIRFSEKVGTLTLTSFPLPHDSAAHVGYAIAADDGDTFAVATDMGHVTEEAIEVLSRCRRVMIEANHDREMLAEGGYPYYLKARILSPRGHLSNTDCAELSCRIAESGCEVIALAHLSGENNEPSIAYSEVRSALDSEGHTGCELIVTDRQYSVRLPDAALSPVDREEFLC